MTESPRENESDLDSPFPIAQWKADMHAAIDQIRDVGVRMIETHRHVSDKAERIVKDWNLEERHQDERRALGELFDVLTAIVTSLQQCHEALHHPNVDANSLHQTLVKAAETIDEILPKIDDTLVRIRHSALDLLLWAKDFAAADDSDLPAKYRESYGQLISYAPKLRPRIAILRDELLALNAGKVHPDVQQLLSALNRYDAIADFARGFVKSISDPPLELVFHDSETFDEQFEQLSTEQRAIVATELNDCCQLLLYDLPEFRRRVEYIRPDLPDDMDASLVVLTIADEFKVIFTVDEDPVFEQMIITMLAIISPEKFEATCQTLLRDLYDQLRG